jgi:hypothetical protein
MPSDKKNNKHNYDGTGLTALVTTLAKKCTGMSENASTKHAIWCAILVSRLAVRCSAVLTPGQRHIVRENPKLARFPHDEEVETQRPAKRNRDGSAKQGKAAEGNDFFSTLGGHFVQQWTDMGDDWKTPEWTKCVLPWRFFPVPSNSLPRFIDQIIATERRLWPSDQLPLIPQTRGVVSQSAGGASRGLAGLTAHPRSQAPDARCVFSSCQD